MIQALIGPATKLLGKFIEDKDQKNKLAHEREKNLKVQVEDSILMKIRKTLLRLSLRLLLMLGQLLEKLRTLISLMHGKFKSLLSWSRGQK